MKEINTIELNNLISKSKKDILNKILLDIFDIEMKCKKSELINIIKNEMLKVFNDNDLDKSENIKYKIYSILK